jgi:hypothetical protein
MHEVIIGLESNSLEKEIEFAENFQEVLFRLLNNITFVAFIKLMHLASYPMSHFPKNLASVDI